MPTTLDAITHEPTSPAKGSVIWLHGLGADGHDFANIVPEFHLPQDLPLRFIFPHAPVRPVSINANQPMRAWYDIYSLDNLRQEDKTNIIQSQQLVGELIQQEIARGIPSEHIILAGFSQGGAMALYTGLRYPKKLAGILALSCYLPQPNTTSAEQHSANASTPIMMAHGLYDAVVAIDLARASYQAVKQLHESITWHEYPMQHNVCPAELNDIAAWLIARFT